MGKKSEAVLEKVVVEKGAEALVEHTAAVKEEVVEKAVVEKEVVEKEVVEKVVVEMVTEEVADPQIPSHGFAQVGTEKEEEGEEEKDEEGGKGGGRGVAYVLGRGPEFAPTCCNAPARPVTVMYTKRDLIYTK